MQARAKSRLSKTLGEVTRLVRVIANFRRRIWRMYKRKNALLMSSLCASMVSIASMNAYAQFVGKNPGPCPAGSAPYNGTCGSPSNINPAMRPPPQATWQDRYGAIAYSVGGSVIGTAKEQRSRRAASRLAMSKCIGPACKVVLEYTNGCGAVAWGPESTGITAFGSGPDSDTAEEQALFVCREAGGGACEITANVCSLPVRVR